MTRLLVLVWVAALLYALFLTAKLVTRRARLTDRPFLIRWMVAWAAMLALSTAIRVTAPETTPSTNQRTSSALSARPSRVASRMPRTECPAEAVAISTRRMSVRR